MENMDLKLHDFILVFVDIRDLLLADIVAS